MARLPAQAAENLGQQFIVENRSGGGGAGSDPWLRSLTATPCSRRRGAHRQPDAYSKLTFDPATDFPRQIALFITAPIVLIVIRRAPTMCRELIALARKEPGKINSPRRAMARLMPVR
jgi:tripartite-type tricarboxylate transporter receptor subunit TctC